jgi:hypothetical protein
MQAISNWPRKTPLDVERSRATASHGPGFALPIDTAEAEASVPSMTTTLVQL